MLSRQSIGGRTYTALRRSYTADKTGLPPSLDISSNALQNNRQQHSLSNKSQQ